MVDPLERVVIDNHDYKALAELDSDVLLLEWDIAVGKEDVEAFARRAKATPGDVLVAPYLLYVPEPV